MATPNQLISSLVYAVERYKELNNIIRELAGREGENILSLMRILSYLSANNPRMDLPQIINVLRKMRSEEGERRGAGGEGRYDKFARNMINILQNIRDKTGINSPWLFYEIFGIIKVLKR